MISRVVIIGAGNVGTHFSKALKKLGKNIVQIYNPTPEYAEKLASEVDATYTGNIREIIFDADLYIISVTDAAINQVADSLHFEKNIVVHTSGSTDISVLKNVSSNYGVIYPLQVMTINRTIDYYNNLPLFIEASNKTTLDVINVLALSLSKDVYVMESAERKILHIAAVIVSNFTAYLFSASGKLLKDINLSFDVLKPLIMETFMIEMQTTTPEVFTGPAVRNDTEVIKEHLRVLHKYPLIQELYKLISRQIIIDKANNA